MKTTECFSEKDIWLSILTVIFSIFALLPQGANAQQNWQYTFPTNNIAFFVGGLDEKIIDNFIKIAKTKDIKTLVITSPGGSIAAGVALGRWVYENQVDIEVDRVCMSSCANYVFPAGKMKTINKGALIVWHGGAEQKNFREMLAQYRALSDRRQKGENLLEEEVKFLAENERRYPNWERQTALQKEFFSLLGLDEYITRIGQEPKNFHEKWTTPIEIMEKFGMKNIHAPDDYGSIKYIDAALPKSGLATKPISLTINSLGSIVQIQD